jgi:hypothetical protein
MARYIGFYWTLPVPFVGFDRLSKDVDEAAAQSLSVRYQRERVRRWVQAQKGALVAERAFLELAPDRSTAAVAGDLDAAVALARAEDATLVLVDFAESFGWRSHPALWRGLREAGAPHVPITPDPVPLDGRLFDPVAHFRAWRQTWDAFRASKPERRAAIAKAIGALAVEEATYAEIARALDADGIRTIDGKTWTKESVRKFMKSS